jgi:hypothetical protein
MPFAKPESSMKLHPLLSLSAVLALAACASTTAQQQPLAGIYAPSRSLQFMLGSNGRYEVDFAMGLAGRGVSFATWGTWRALPDGRACFTPARFDSAHPQAYGRHDPSIGSGRMQIDVDSPLQEAARVMPEARYRADPAARPSADEFMADDDGNLPSVPLIFALPVVEGADGKQRQMRLYRFTPRPEFNRYWFALSPVPEGTSAGMETMLLPLLFGEPQPDEPMPTPEDKELCGHITLEKQPLKAEEQVQIDQYFVEALDPAQVEHDGQRYERLLLTPLPAENLPPQQTTIATGITDPAALQAFMLRALTAEIDDETQPAAFLRFVQSEEEKQQSANPKGTLFAHAPLGGDKPALRLSAQPMPDGMVNIELWSFGDPPRLTSHQLRTERNALELVLARFARFLKLPKK